MKRWLSAVAAMLAAGCTIPERPADPDRPAVPVAEPPAQPPVPTPVEPASLPRTLAEYKVAVAHAILHANAQHTFIGKLPEVLKSVVVLQITVDRNGFPYEVKLFRSNGYKALEARAIQSVRAGQLPKPSDLVTGGRGYVAFTETWLYRDDGKFQIRTLADPQ